MSGVTEIFARFRCFDKKQRVIDHVFAHLAVGSLVVLEKDKKLAGGERMFQEAFGQTLGMIAVGARHRC